MFLPQIDKVKAKEIGGLGRRREFHASKGIIMICLGLIKIVFSVHVGKYGCACSSHQPLSTQTRNLLFFMIQFNSSSVKVSLIFATDFHSLTPTSLGSPISAYVKTVFFFFLMAQALDFAVSCLFIFKN